MCGGLHRSETESELWKERAGKKRERDQSPHYSMRDQNTCVLKPHPSLPLLVSHQVLPSAIHIHDHTGESNVFPVLLMSNTVHSGVKTYILLGLTPTHH